MNPVQNQKQEPEETVEYTFELEKQLCRKLLHLQTLVSQTAARSMSRKKSCTTPIRKKIEDIARDGGSSVFELTGEDIPTLTVTDPSQEKIEQAF